MGEGRAVVIAAYISALRAAGADRRGRAGAVEAAILLTSVIAAAGGYHHVLAEGDRVLVEGYYPEARRLPAAESRGAARRLGRSARATSTCCPTLRRPPPTRPASPSATPRRGPSR